MDCFIKKIFYGKGGEAHSYFVRFGKGIFEGRAILNLMKTSKIKLKGSFEWAENFVEFASEIADLKFSGIILSKHELQFEGRKKGEIFQYEVEGISSKQVQEIKNKAYSMLLDAEGNGIILKIKKKLPKPGKAGEGKVDDKFCQLEMDLKYWDKVKDAFMLPECKKCRISHTFVIEDIIMPKDEKDFAKIRELAKRKGKIIRKLEVDKQSRIEEKEFEA